MISRFIFLVPALSQPRCIKRITSIFEMGYSCDVFGYKRGKYDVNEYPKNISVHVLDIVNDGNYFRKAIKSWRCFSKVISSNKGEGAVFYAFGFFQAFVCALKGVRYIYEISDIFYAYPRLEIIKGLLRTVDKCLIRKSSLTILTSGGFQEFFKIKNEKVLIVPNKVSDKISNIERHPISCDSHSLRFGFVGSIKYDSVFRFAETIGEYYPNYRFDFYGSAVGDVKKRIDGLIAEYKNVDYHGVYKNPDDLERIYSNIDIVIACYDVNSENERIAEPNKLYESLYFCKPIIVSDGIYLSKRVKELDCGFTINASSKDNIKHFVDSLTVSELDRLSMNEYHLQDNSIIYLPDSLKRAIEKHIVI